MKLLARKVSAIATMLAIAWFATVATTRRARSNTVTGPISTSRDVALEYASERYSPSKGELLLTDGLEVKLPTVGVTLHRFKSISAEGVHLVDIDAATGAVVDGVKLIDSDLANKRAADGKLGASLKQKLNGEPDVSQSVIIWLKTDQSQADSSLPEKQPARGKNAPQLRPEEIQAIIQRGRQRMISASASAKRTALGSLLTKDKNARAHEFLPIAYATLSPADIAEFGTSDDVVSIDLDEVGGNLELDIVGDTLDYKPQVHTNLGFDGTGQKIVQVEVTGGGINGAVDDHPCIDQVNSGQSTSGFSHATAVAGILVCQDGTNTGLAPDAQLRETASDTESDRTNFVTSGSTWGGGAFNFSYAAGTQDLVPGSEDKFLDGIFSTDFRTLVKSAGNRGCATAPATPDNRVTKPGLGYNVFTIGNFNDNNTATRVGDTMNSCSSWVDPISTNSDRQKPEVAAPGTNITGPDTSGGYTDLGSGTSYAAPTVAGTATLMMEANSTMVSWPEVVKAGIMATARYNIESGVIWSDKDGAGGVSTLDAVDLVRGGGPSNSDWYGTSVSCASFPLTAFTINLVAFKTARVAMVWHQDVNYVNYSTQPSADLDLVVLKPDGSTLVAMNSATYDNTYEIVAFNAPVTGTYTVKVEAPNCYTSPRYIGFAWYQNP